MPNGNGQKTCFVVMGFGVKTDFQSSPQRKLDLNRTYEDIIEPSVKACNVECIRADKIIHSTVIDKPMYEQLLNADLVIADLSTSNANAIYELGVRHALRPYTTIVMSEEGFAFPFDLNHVSILKYKHNGEDIGYNMVLRTRESLMAKIKALLDRNEVDSPVHMFLPSLRGTAAALQPAAAMAPAQDDKSFADLMQSLAQKKREVKVPADWLAVVEVANRLRNLQPNDPYVIQQLALATYKSKHPFALQACVNAKETLSILAPETSSDAETVGLWGAIHKRLWELGQVSLLSTAVRAYARGYFIKNDFYNGINFAYLLNARAAGTQGDDAIADRVIARRTRTEVLALCDAALASGTCAGEDAFWLTATKVEALAGLGRKAESDALRQQLINAPLPPSARNMDSVADALKPPPQWMIDTMDEQLSKLAALNP